MKKVQKAKKPRKQDSPVFISEKTLFDRIYLVRNEKVMLDKDLAQLYGVKPTRLREQVKRNAQKFPDHFMFQLTEKECKSMVSQNAIPSRQHLGGYTPYAFTEHGVLMLATILKSEKAINASLRLVEIFVKMRDKLSIASKIEVKLARLEKRISQHDDDIQLMLDSIRQILNVTPEERPRIGFRRDKGK